MCFLKRIGLGWEIDLMCSEVLSCWASTGAFGVQGGQVLCRHGPEAAGSEVGEVVRRGAIEGHAP